jgi:nucleoside-diphosphate-sugar epimerase
MSAALDGCVGVVHLAAVSRVIDGERDPDRCRTTNIGALASLLQLLHRRSDPPWLVFASSREVYGEPALLPVSEDAPLAPVNVYGETKAYGEELVARSRAEGLRTATLRLSNVYGGARDHATRVVPAFVRAAIVGGELLVEGADRLLDFTFLDDTIEAIVAAIDRIENQLPTMHVLTGRGTTLGELAALAIELAHAGKVVPGPSRSFDVGRFVGDPALATRVLGFTARTHVREGIAKVIAAYLEANG